MSKKLFPSPREEESERREREYDEAWDKARRETLIARYELGSHLREIPSLFPKKHRKPIGF